MLVDCGNSILLRHSRAGGNLVVTVISNACETNFDGIKIERVFYTRPAGQNTWKYFVNLFPAWYFGGVGTRTQQLCQRARIALNHSDTFNPIDLSCILNNDGHWVTRAAKDSLISITTINYWQHGMNNGYSINL